MKPIKLTFLSAAVPLTKTFTLNNGVLEKQAHPRIPNCTSYEEEVSSIEEFKSALEAHAEQGHCLLKGNTNRKLVNESRAGSTDANAKTAWTCFDLDGLKGCINVNDLLQPIGLDQVDHIIQYSSSMGIVDGRGMSAHIIMLHDPDAVPEKLKRYLTNLNLTTKILIDNMSLARTNLSLRWALDISTCQNDKLIYIAPPILGKGVKDGFKGERIVLVKGSKRAYSLPADIPTQAELKGTTEKAVNLKRAELDLPPRPKTVYNTTGSMEWMADPDKAQVTGIKEDGPWIHLNLNGGDSWGYYHLKSNPEFIQNFKNEPTYRTADLVPEYWETVRPVESITDVDTGGTQYFVFRDFRTATYSNAIWTPETQELKMSQAKGKEQLRDFLKSHNQPTMDHVVDWDVVFNPHSDIVVDTEKRIINTFQASEYLKAKPSTGARVPPVIYKTLWNSLGSDQEAYERWLNWAATMFQLRKKVGSCWLLYGTTGTGKGTLGSEILGPIFKYVAFRKSRDLMSPYNEFLENSLLLVVDEAELGGKNGGSILESDIRNFVSEETVSIRRMHMAPYNATSYTNTHFHANGNLPTNLKDNDRRFNVAPLQRNKIVYKSGERDQIPDELMEMSQFFAAYKIDPAMARESLKNEARKALIFMGKVGTENVIDSLKNGNYDFFVSGKPALIPSSTQISNQQAIADYVELVDSMFEREYLLREEVRILLGYLMENIPTSPFKFETLMKHYDVFFENIKHNGKTHKGYRVKWHTDSNLVTPTTGKPNQATPDSKPLVKRMKSG